MVARIGICAAALLLAVAGPARAVPLDLTLADAGDIYAAYISVAYDPVIDALSVTGFPLTLDRDGLGVTLPITDGTFQINATINDSGVATAGTITIGGAVPALGVTGPSLLVGSLAAFGFAPEMGSPLEFVFMVTGGDLASLYSTAGVILTHGGFGGSFGAEFGTSFGAIADTAPLAVPEPATFLLLAGGGAVLAVRRYWKKRNDAR